MILERHWRDYIVSEARGLHSDATASRGLVVILFEMDMTWETMCVHTDIQTCNLAAYSLLFDIHVKCVSIYIHLYTQIDSGFTYGMWSGV